MQAMCCDYGFRSGFGRLYQGGDGEIPKNFLQLVRTQLRARCSAAHQAAQPEPLPARRAGTTTRRSFGSCGAPSARTSTTRSAS